MEQGGDGITNVDIYVYFLTHVSEMSEHGKHCYFPIVFYRHVKISRCKTNTDNELF